ncbi:MAG: hypothetical protein IOC86_08665 [Aestuariivirga sp.]|nr:hypothetical protein [Aestuariivirga sp.]
MVCLLTVRCDIEEFGNNPRGGARVRIGAGQLVQLCLNHAPDARNAAAAFGLSAAAAEHLPRGDAAGIDLGRQALHGKPYVRAGDDVAVADDHRLTC